ncbi:hypothetical protein GGR53DRAFT_531261 [Hypoxylon sp. FL1150]|nr:hypothetical protein GGR53DRAFT_531261 [Hypoxylon sp. FL1150]
MGIYRKNRRPRRRLTNTGKEIFGSTFKQDRHGARPQPTSRSPGRDNYASKRSTTESSAYTDTLGETIRNSKLNSIIATKTSECEQHFDTESKFFFGCPGPRDPRFEKLVWAPQPAPPHSPADRALEDVLREHPQVQFEGLDQSALNATVKAVLQVTDEAAFEWLSRWCNRTKLTEVFESLIAENRKGTTATAEPLLVPVEAMYFGRMNGSLAKLYRNCHAIGMRSSALRPVDVAGTVDSCIIFCLSLKDEKRVGLLKETRELVLWIPIGLSCRKVDEQRKASKEICHNARTALTVNKWEEARILGRAVLRYEKHRVHFKDQLLNQAKKLLDATTPADTRRPERRA